MEIPSEITQIDFPASLDEISAPTRRLPYSNSEMCEKRPKVAAVKLELLLRHFTILNRQC